MKTLQEKLILLPMTRGKKIAKRTDALADLQAGTHPKNTAALRSFRFSVSARADSLRE